MRHLAFIISAILVILGIDFIVASALRNGVDRFYGLKRHSKVLMIGHSHLMLATDKDRIEKETGLSISKYTREGVNVFDRKLMVQQYLNSPYSDSLKFCLYGVDLCTFTGEGLSANSYKLFYPFIDDPKVSEYVKENTTPLDYWTKKILRSTRFNDDNIKNGAIRGWNSDWSNKKYGKIDIGKYKIKIANRNERSIKMNPVLIQEFTNTIGLLTDRGVRVILVNTPTLDLLNNYEPEKYLQVINWFSCFAAANPMVDFWDFNPEYSSRYDLFHDRIHLNSDGQAEITTRIIEKLDSLLPS